MGDAHRATPLGTLTPEDFNAWFDHATTSLFRLETLQAYDTTGDVAYAAFRAGTARPERSVRTSPWVARIARTSLTGVTWTRVRVVTWPLTDYTRYELIGYIESQAVGDRTLLLDAGDRESHGPDFWLRDGGTNHAEAIAMHYDPDGTIRRYEVVTDPDRLAALHAVAVGLSEQATPLNEFLASNALVS